MNEWENRDHSSPCRCGHGILSHNVRGCGECYGPNAQGGVCGCRGYADRTVAGEKSGNVIVTVTSAPSVPAPRAIEWAILGVLLWILADVAAGSPAHPATGAAAHSLFSAIGGFCYVRCAFQAWKEM